jgi:hypothetical protein
MPCFWRCPTESSLVLQYQASERFRLCPRNKSVCKHCREKLHGICDVCAAPPNINEHNDGQYGSQAVFPISNTARCFWRTWPVRSACLAMSDYFLWGYVKCKSYETRSANTDDLKQRSEYIQGILKEILQYVMTSLPSRGANQCHILTLTIHGHEMCLQKLIIFFSSLG